MSNTDFFQIAALKVFAELGQLIEEDIRASGAGLQASAAKADALARADDERKQITQKLF